MRRSRAGAIPSATETPDARGPAEMSRHSLPGLTRTLAGAADCWRSEVVGAVPVWTGRGCSVADR